jgi:hypothetical protein
MNVKLVSKLGVMALAFCSLQTMAQTGPRIVVGTGSEQVGSATPVVISVDYDGDGTVAAFQVDVTYDTANLTADLSSCGGPLGGANFTCTDIGPGAIRFLGDDAQLNPLPSGSLGSISFDISSAAIADYDLLVPPSDELYSNNLGDNVPSTGSTPGLVQVTAGPQPLFGSTPDAATGVTLSGQVSTTLQADVVINNDGGEDGSTLTYSCSKTVDTDNKFTISGDTTDFSVPKGSSGTVTVACDSSVSGGPFTGEMQCTHDGTNASPATFALSCTVNPGPLPEYTSNPAAGTPIVLNAPQEGDPITPAQIAISNSGDTGTTLTGTCSVTGNSQISVADGSFSVMQGGAADIQSVSCDSSKAGSYSATLECTHNGSNATATYAVTCDVGPAGGAIFRSDPVPGSNTPIGVDVVVGDTPAPTSTLTFYNDADPLDNDLNIACTKSGDAQITVSPDISGGTTIAPQANLPVTFSCDTAAAGSYTATYSCDYTVDGLSVPTGGNGGVQQATYTYTCDVRDTVSDVDPMPPSGTTLTEMVQAGGTASFTVDFDEVANEGETGEVTSCSLADGTNFTITSPIPADFPVTIPANGSVTVTVEGTDPDDGSSPTDTLTCTYTDTANPSGTDAVYPLVLAVGGGNTTIDVTKVFTDDNPGEVLVTLTCDTGLPLTQSFMISEGNGVSFVVTSFESGEMNCSVTEEATSAYSGNYVASGDSASVDNDPDAPGCHFLAIDGGDGNACSITNSPDPVDVVIEKEWLFAGNFSELEIFYKLTLYCDTEIVGGDPYFNGTSNGPASDVHLWFQEFEGTSPDNRIFTAEVIPGYPSSDCWVEEEVFSDAVEVDNGCGDLVVSAGSGDSCTVTNTVFFEGIPTLSQYGLAIMALLMLGIGMVGFRRFS